MREIIETLVKGKRVLILGFGKEGQSTYSLLSEIGGYSEIAVADRNPVSVQLPSSTAVISGEDYQSCLNDFDVVIKSPGVVIERDIASYSCFVTSQTDLFFRKYRNQIVGITGTKGKSTTSTLLHHILKENGRDTILAGNIGIPAFDTIPLINAETVIVYELSCHQLEFTRSSPAFSVLLNIFEDHLDHYGTMERYIAAKKNIYLHQNKDDTLICNIFTLPEEGEAHGGVISASASDSGADIYVSGSDIRWQGQSYTIPTDEIALFGQHNYYNISIAYCICKKLGLSDAEFDIGLKSYKTLPHRMEYFATVDGVRYFDDSISTICEATIKALCSIPNAETVLIGGMDRGIDYSDLVSFLQTHSVPNIILMYDSGRRIFEQMSELPQTGNTLYFAENLAQGVAVAKRTARRGTSCILSPAAASYGYFKNFEQRGEAFKELVLSAAD
ncbi:MAG: UDP-N-acetylmuramoyl-L-alanine--D-glutamate ligase [Oscillospiraceae bacterium]|jgi:UDP-N-acetylmuramoylalanine--D-glutamate ligase|nr:UDP-N-acetylmuramoyl-L-alanine--D-glutamate ligase [Oscillospiraceae bacterium]